MVPFTVEIHPLTHPCLRHDVTIDLIYLSQKASNNIPEPTDQSSFGGVQIYHQNRSSVLRSRVNRTFKYLTNFELVFEQKNCRSIKIGLQSQFN